MNELFCTINELYNDNGVVGLFRVFGTKEQLEFFTQHAKLNYKLLQTIIIPDNIRIFDSVAISDNRGELIKLYSPDKTVSVSIIISSPILHSLINQIADPIYQDDTRTIIVGEGYYHILDTKEWALINALLPKCLSELYQRDPDSFILNDYAFINKTIEE